MKVNEELLAHVKKILSSQLGEEIAAFTYTEEEGFEFTNMSMGVMPAKITRKSIAREWETDGWQTWVAVHVYNYPHAPDDVDICDVGEPQHHLNFAIAKMVAHYMEETLANTLCFETDSGYPYF